MEFAVSHKGFYPQVGGVNPTSLGALDSAKASRHIEGRRSFFLQQWFFKNKDRIATKAPKELPLDEMIASVKRRKDNAQLKAKDPLHETRMQRRVDNLNMLRDIMCQSKGQVNQVDILDVWGWGFRVDEQYRAMHGSGVSEYDTFILRINNNVKVLQLDSSFQCQIDNFWGFNDEKQVPSEKNQSASVPKQLDFVGKSATVNLDPYASRLETGPGVSRNLKYSDVEYLGVSYHEWGHVNQCAMQTESRYSRSVRPQEQEYRQDEVIEETDQGGLSGSHMNLHEDHHHHHSSCGHDHSTCDHVHHHANRLQTDSDVGKPEKHVHDGCAHAKETNKVVKLIPEALLKKAVEAERLVVEVKDGSDGTKEPLKAYKYTATVKGVLVDQYMSEVEYSNRIVILRRLTDVMGATRERSDVQQMGELDQQIAILRAWESDINNLVNSSESRDEYIPIILEAFRKTCDGYEGVYVEGVRHRNGRIEIKITNNKCIQSDEEPEYVEARKDNLIEGLKLLSPCGNFNKLSPRYAGLFCGLNPQGGNNGQVLGGGCSGRSDHTIDVVLHCTELSGHLDLARLDRERGFRERECGPGRRMEVDLIFAMTSQTRLNAFIGQRMANNELTMAQLTYLSKIKIDDSGKVTLEDEAITKKALLSATVSFEGGKFMTYAELIYNKAVLGPYSQKSEKTAHGIYAVQCHKEFNQQMIDLGLQPFPELEIPETLETEIEHDTSEAYTKLKEEFESEPNKTLAMVPDIVWRDQRTSSCRATMQVGGRFLEYLEFRTDSGEQVMLRNDLAQINKIYDLIREKLGDADTLVGFVDQMSVELQSHENVKTALEVKIIIQAVMIIVEKVDPTKDIGYFRSNHKPGIELINKSEAVRVDVDSELREKIKQNLRFLSPLGAFGNESGRAGGVSFGCNPESGNNGLILGASCGEASDSTIDDVLKVEMQDPQEGFDLVKLEKIRRGRETSCGFGRRSEVDIVVAMTSKKSLETFISQMRSELRLLPEIIEYLQSIIWDSDGVTVLEVPQEARRKLVQTKVKFTSNRKPEREVTIGGVICEKFCRGDSQHVKFKEGLQLAGMSRWTETGDGSESVPDKFKTANAYQDLVRKGGINAVLKIYPDELGLDQRREVLIQGEEMQEAWAFESPKGVQVISKQKEQLLTRTLGLVDTAFKGAKNLEDFVETINHQLEERYISEEAYPIVLQAVLGVVRTVSDTLRVISNPKFTKQVRFEPLDSNTQCVGQREASQKKESAYTIQLVEAKKYPKEKKVQTKEKARVETNLKVLSPLGTFGGGCRVGGLFSGLKYVSGANGLVLGNSCGGEQASKTVEAVLKSKRDGQPEFDFVKLQEERDRRGSTCGFGRRGEIDLAVAMTSHVQLSLYIDKMEKEKELQPAELKYLRAIQFDKHGNASISSEAKRAFLLSTVQCDDSPGMTTYAGGRDIPPPVTYAELIYKKHVKGKPTNASLFSNELKELRISWPILSTEMSMTEEGFGKIPVNGGGSVERVGLEKVHARYPGNVFLAQKGRELDCVKSVHANKRPERSVLRSCGGDYGKELVYKDSVVETSHIDSQGPTKEGVDNFLKMAIQSGSTTIVCLTKQTELSYVRGGYTQVEKVAPYWEPEFYQSKDYKGVFRINNVVDISEHSDNANGLVVRQIEFEELNNGESYVPPKTHRINQLHFTEWPDFGVPECVKTQEHLIERVKLYEHNSGGAIIHCSAGVGRTGTFELMYDMSNLDKKELEKIDWENSLKFLRQYRYMAVQKYQQLRYAEKYRQYLLGKAVS